MALFHFRMHLHSAVLHSELVVVKPNVLHVWFPLFGVLDPCHHLLGNDDPVVLFPSMCRRLSLVVAKLFDEWLHCCLPLRLLLSLFCNKVTDPRCSLDVPLLRLHDHHGIPFLPSHRIHRLLRLLLVHSQDLQRRQSGLNKRIFLNLI